MAIHQQSPLRPLSDLTNVTIYHSSPRPCSSIGSSLPHIHDEVIESHDRRKGKGKAVVAKYGSSTKAILKLKQINKFMKKPPKASRRARNIALVPKGLKKLQEPSWGFTPPLDYIEKQRAYFAEIDAFELFEEEVSESELE